MPGNLPLYPWHALDYTGNVANRMARSVYESCGVASVSPAFEQAMPDGDTVGCAGALCRAIRQIGKTAYRRDHPEITRRYAARLEEMIRRRPELWVWSHKRWKYLPTREQLEQQKAAETCPERS